MGVECEAPVKDESRDESTVMVERVRGGNRGDVPMIRPRVEWEELGGVRVLTDRRLLAHSGVRVAFTARSGGGSPPPYESLNLAFHVGDDPRNVVANRKRVCAALGIPFPRMTCAEQVHGRSVVAVGEREVASGRDCYETSIEGTDAMVTSLTGMPLTMFFADCVPVVLVQPAARIVGIAHAGWRGVSEGVLEATVAEMCDAYSCDPAHLLAYVGPSIGPCCYEVGNDRVELFRRRFGRGAVAEDDRVDLGGLVETSLDRLGVQPENIAAVRLCTADNTHDFFSFRAEKGETGRHAAIVCIE